MAREIIKQRSGRTRLIPTPGISSFYASSGEEYAADSEGAIYALIEDVFDLLSLGCEFKSREGRPRGLKLALPTIMKEDTIMNFEIKNTTIATIKILTVDAAGDVVPALSGDVFTVASSDPAKLKVDMILDPSGSPAIVMTPMVKDVKGLIVTVSDSDHLTSDVQTVDIVADMTPAAVSLDLSGATFTPQPVPLA